MKSRARSGGRRSRSRKVDGQPPVRRSSLVAFAMSPGHLLSCVIAVTFLGAAAWASWQFAESCVLFARLRNAVPVPARIVSLRREGGRHSYIVATYTYEFGGRAFSSDTRGHFSRGKYSEDELKVAKENGTLLTCFVAPDDPSVSVLENTFSPARFIVNLGFVSAFLCGALVTSVHAYNTIRRHIMSASGVRPQNVQ